MIKRPFLRSSILTVTAVYSLSACAALNEDASNTLPVTEIYTSALCNISEQGITEVKDKTSLEEILTKANSHRLNSKPEDLSSIDFNASNIYLIAMGIRPNAGYSLKFIGPDASLNKDKLTLPISVELPSENAMYAQMMASPCTLVSVPKGAYDTIEVEGWDTLK